MNIAAALNYDKLTKEEKLKLYEAFSATYNRVSLFRFVLASNYLENLDQAKETADTELIKALKFFADFEIEEIPQSTLRILKKLFDKKCHLILAQGADKELKIWLKKLNNENTVTECISQRLSQKLSLNEAWAYHSIVNENFYNHEGLANSMSARLKESILDFDGDLQNLVEKLESLTERKSSFEVGTLGGEALLAKDRNLTRKDIELILDTDAFWSKQKYENFGEQPSKALENLRAHSQGYNIELTEELHKMLLRKIEALNDELSIEDRIHLWNKLTERGTSVPSDENFDVIYENIKHEKTKKKFQKNALRRGHLHDSHIKKKLLHEEIDSILKSSTGQERLKDPEERVKLIHEIATLSKNSLGEGLAHNSILEDLSNRIDSTRIESSEIEKLKGHLEQEAKNRDDIVKLLESILQEIRSWSKDRQWDLILFLVGHKTTITHKNTSRYLYKYGLTPLSLRKNFQNLPKKIQNVLIDGALSHKGGLMENPNKVDYWTQTIIDYLVQMVEEPYRDTAREIIDAFVHTYQSSEGLKYFRSTLFAYVLVASQKGQSSAETIAQICLEFGTFGIKLGQFLLATKVLPEAQNQALSKLEDKARYIEREEMYKDLEEIFEGEIPYEIKNIEGSASLKYVVRAIRKSDGEEVVLKVLSKDAKIHTPFEKKLMKRIADRLVEVHGAKYRLFKFAVSAAVKAIETELSFEAEVQKSEIASENMYKNCNHENISFSLMKEKLLHERVIEAEYAPGKSFSRVTKELQKELSKAITVCEKENLFPSSEENGEAIYLDHDRHPGNYRVGENFVHPIDFGQLQVMSAEEREQIISLSAIAAILNTMGQAESQWAINSIMRPVSLKILEILKLNTKDHKEASLSYELAAQFSHHPNDEFTTSYYRLISLLDEKGFLDCAKIAKMGLYSFPKALMQISRFNSFLEGDEKESLEEHFYKLAKTKAERYAKEMELKEPEFKEICWWLLGY